MRSKMIASTAASAAPPGPRGYPLVGVLPMLLHNPLQLLHAAASTYGDVVSLPVGPKRFYLLNHPDHIKHVLQDQYRNYHKGANFATAKRLIGEGLAMSEGDFWLRQRRLAQPAFHHQRIATMATMMTDATAEMLYRWAATAAPGHMLDIAEEMKHLTQRIILQTMFGTDIGAETEAVCRALTVALTHITRSFWMSALPNRLTPGNRQFEQALRTLDNVVYRIIYERRRSARDPGDLLAMLLQARDAETGEGMSDKQVRDEVMTIFIAGHDTVASTLAWTWHLLAQNPQIERRLLDELAVLDGQTPTFQDLPRLVYTRMVIEEAMRLYPPAWGMFRTPLVDDIIGGYHIQAGSVVILSPYVLHRTASFWEQPDQFQPERFTPERSAGRPRYAYIPFGGGPRVCIGNSLALMESQLIVAMVAQRYKLRSIPGHLVQPYIEVVLQPRHGLRMTVAAR